MLLFTCGLASIAAAAAAAAAAVTVEPGWPSVPMREPRTQAGPASWAVFTDSYLAAGSELTNHSATVAEAETWCGSQVACLGFTYNTADPTAIGGSSMNGGGGGGAGGGAGGGPSTSYNVHFKSTAAQEGGKGWVAVVKSIPRVLSATFTAGMVLQHDSACLWGWGNNRTAAEVTVATDAGGGVTNTTTVGADNSWRLCLPAMAPGGPWTLNVSVAVSFQCKQCSAQSFVLLL